VRALSLSHNWIGDAGVAVLCDAIRARPTVTALDIPDNKVGGGQEPRWRCSWRCMRAARPPAAAVSLPDETRLQGAGGQRGTVEPSSLAPAAEHAAPAVALGAGYGRRCDRHRAAAAHQHQHHAAAPGHQLHHGQGGHRAGRGGCAPSRPPGTGCLAAGRAARGPGPAAVYCLSNCCCTQLLPSSPQALTPAPPPLRPWHCPL
jgi:hypothetical protein